MYSGVHRNNSKIAVIKLSQGKSSHCIAQNLEHEFLQPPPFWNHRRDCWNFSIFIDSDVDKAMSRLKI